jgi:hypothetical protein
MATVGFASLQCILAGLSGLSSRQCLQAYLDPQKLADKDQYALHHTMAFTSWLANTQGRMLPGARIESLPFIEVRLASTVLSEVEMHGEQAA